MATSNTAEAPILVVAALSRELAELARKSLPSLTLLETGEGIVNTERHLEAWLEQRSARTVLSIGFAGALSSSLKAGDLVIADEVRDSSARPDARLLTAARRVRTGGSWIHFGVALTSNEILWQAHSKRSLAESLAVDEIGAVDMESKAIAGVCGRHGLPFLIARSITDLLDEDLPLDFNQFRKGDGRVDSKGVMKAALASPAALRGLWQLRKRSQLCAERMAEFVSNLVPLIS
jgi:adenosylhomocysteine nucleosidase